MKKHYREAQDAWEGFDGGEYVYNEKAEKRYESSVWRFLAGAAILMLCFVIFMQAKELVIITTGNRIEAAYSESLNGAETAKYVDTNGKIHLYDVTGLNSVHTEEEIILYYVENIDEAIPKTSWKQWIVYYSFFAVVGGISIWRLRKIYKK